MSTVPREDPGRPTPGRPARRLAPRWALLAVALTALALDGCASSGGFRPLAAFGMGGGGCGGGGGCKLFSLFRRGSTPADPCAEPGCISSDIPFEGTTTIAPGSGTIVTPGVAVPQAAEPPALDLQPIESAPGGASTRDTTKPAYQAAMTRAGARPQRRASAGGVAIAATTPPATPPAREVAAPPLIRLLDELPPPAEEVADPAPAASNLPAVAIDAAATPPGPATGAPAAPGAAPGAAATLPAAPAPPSIEEPDSPPPSEPAPLSASPGIARFKVLQPQLAAGDVPRPEGWAWLAETSYRTVLDLRPRALVAADDLAQIDRHGLRHVAFPISAETIDAEHLRRFEEELALAGARPLFFFDVEGQRAAVLWYLHRVTVDKIEPAAARREAEEIGPGDPALWTAAETYLAGLNAPRVSLAGPAPDEPVANPEPADSVDVATEPPATPAAPAAAVQFAADRPAETPAASDPTAWRPFAALFLTILGVPFAYWSRSSLGLRRRRRASLPAPGPGPRSLPLGSDA